MYPTQEWIVDDLLIKTLNLLFGRAIKKEVSPRTALMSYFSNVENRSPFPGLGCGPACKCGPCKSGLNGFDEWYEKEEAEESSARSAVPPEVSKPRPPGPGSKSQVAGLNGPGFNLGYYGNRYGAAFPEGMPPRRQAYLIRRPRVFDRRTHFALSGPPAAGAAGPVSSTCNIDPGEVAASHSEAGILTNDVEITDKGVLVTDFGIDSGSVKAGAKRGLASLIQRLETDPSIAEITIRGFSDCIGPGGATYQLWLRKRRALKVLDLLGPIARRKVKFVGAAPITELIGPNTDKAARARNRSVLIEFNSQITFEPDRPITAPPCHEQVMRRSLNQLRDDPTLDPKVKSRLGAAIGNSLVGRDDSFIRPGSTSFMFPFRWSGIGQYFREQCNQPGGGATLIGGVLSRKLIELDQDISNGLESFKRETRKFSSIQDKKAVLHADFGVRLEALFRKKAQTAYAEY